MLISNVFIISMSLLLFFLLHTVILLMLYIEATHLQVLQNNLRYLSVRVLHYHGVCTHTSIILYHWVCLCLQQSHNCVSLTKWNSSHQRSLTTLLFDYMKFLQDFRSQLWSQVNWEVSLEHSCFHLLLPYEVEFCPSTIIFKH
jgi:hypothetical protein